MELLVSIATVFLHNLAGVPDIATTRGKHASQVVGATNDRCTICRDIPIISMIGIFVPLMGNLTVNAILHTLRLKQEDKVRRIATTIVAVNSTHILPVIANSIVVSLLCRIATVFMQQEHISLACGTISIALAINRKVSLTHTSRTIGNDIGNIICREILI